MVTAPWCVAEPATLCCGLQGHTTTVLSVLYWNSCTASLRCSSSATRFKITKATGIGRGRGHTVVYLGPHGIWIIRCSLDTRPLYSQNDISTREWISGKDRRRGMLLALELMFSLRFRDSNTVLYDRTSWEGYYVFTHVNWTDTSNQGCVYILDTFAIYSRIIRWAKCYWDSLRSVSQYVGTSCAMAIDCRVTEESIYCLISIVSIPWQALHVMWEFDELLWLNLAGKSAGIRVCLPLRWLKKYFPRRVCLISYRCRLSSSKADIPHLDSVKSVPHCVGTLRATMANSHWR